MIEVQGLSKNYDNLKALDDVSFSQAQQGVLGVLGLNGAGKSTLLRILAGELTPSSGSARIGPADLATDPQKVRANVGYLHEDAPLYRDMRVRDFLAYMGQLNGVTPGALSARIQSVAQTTHITDHLDRVIDELSMGYRKRVGIAQAVLHEPAVVILDEPVSALDPAEIIGMRQVIRDLGAQHTVLISSHILNEIEEVCDRVLVLDQGRIVFQGTEADLHRRTAQDGRVLIKVRTTEETLRAALPAGATLDSSHADGEYLTCAVSLLQNNREELVAALVQGGVGVWELTSHHSDLEQLFLNLVQEAHA